MILLFIVAALILALAPAAFAQSNSDQRPDSFVDAARVAPGLLVEARYAGAHNFVGRPIEGYDKPIFVRADGKASYATVAQVMAALSNAGFAKINLLTDTGGPSSGASAKTEGADDLRPAQ